MRHKLSFRQWLAAAFLFFSFFFLVVCLYTRDSEDSRFTRFAEGFLLDQLTSNPINFHFSVENASGYHVDEKDLRLPVYQPRQALSSEKELPVIRQRLNEFHPDRLSSGNRQLYTILSRYLTVADAVNAYPYFDEPLSPSSGVPSELPVLLAEYRLQSTDDIENYFSLLAQIPDYFAGLMIYEQEKAQAGLFMAEDTADKVIGQCADLMSPDALASDAHFLKRTFSERLNTLIESGLLDEQSAASYCSENDRLLTTVVGPAYDRLADGLTLLKGSSTKACGLSHYPGGRDYYAALLRQQTGSMRSVKDIKTLLYNDLTSNYHALLLLLQENPGLQTLLRSDSEFLPEMSPQAMLYALQQQMTGSFPALSTDSSSAVCCTVKYVDSSMEPYTAPAFYMLPCIDNTSDNTIYINTKDTSDRLSLFTTLAHEGYPGHLYQTVYCYQYWKDQQITPLRSILYYGGFTEGWALYVELLSYDYAAALVKDEQPEASAYYQACRLDRQIQLCLYSLLDIAIHYDDAATDDVRQILSSLGVADDAGIAAVYEYIAEEPANYPKYYLGYLEIEELKKQAALTWSTDDQPITSCSDPAFLYRFHSFLLHNGPADFELLSSIMLSR